MKRGIKKYYVITLLAILVLILFFIIKIYNDKLTTKNNIEYSIGVIETSAVDENSYVNLYSFDGELNGITKLNISDVNSGFLFPVRDGDKVYLNSMGTYKSGNDEVVEYNLEDNKYSTHKISSATISLDKYENYIFTTSNSSINKYDINSKEIVNSIIIPACPSHLNVFNRQLYAFSQLISDKNSNVLYIIDIDSMEIIKTIPLKDRSFQADSMQVQDDIYFTNWFDTANGESNSLSKYNTKTGTLADIKISNGSNQLRIKDNNLFISIYNPVQRTGNSINILNLEDDSIKVLNFNHRVEEFDIYEDKLIILDDSKMYIYQLDDDYNVNLINEFNVKNTDNKNYRISGFFIK